MRRYNNRRVGGAGFYSGRRALAVGLGAGAVSYPATGMGGIEGSVGCRAIRGWRGVVGRWFGAARLRGAAWRPVLHVARHVAASRRRKWGGPPGAFAAGPVRFRYVNFPSASLGELRCCTAWGLLRSTGHPHVRSCITTLVDPAAMPLRRGEAPGHILLLVLKRAYTSVHLKIKFASADSGGSLRSTDISASGNRFPLFPCIWMDGA